MKIFNANEMSLLSFPDYDVQKIEISQKSLKIFVEDAWLDLDGGQELGKGILFFEDWESFTLRYFDSDSEKWTVLNLEEMDPLRDICECQFTEFSAILSGFAKHSGEWTEWTILNSKNHAEFG